MQSQLYRQQSIDRVSSQEQIRDYLRVTSPRLWMVILAAAVLLAGFLVWYAVANQEVTLPVKVSVENTSTRESNVILAEFQVPSAQRDNYRPGMKVRFAGITGEIKYFVDMENITSVIVWAESPKTAVPDGEYDAEVLFESSAPLSDLLN